MGLKEPVSLKKHKTRNYAELYFFIYNSLNIFFQCCPVKTQKPFLYL